MKKYWRWIATEPYRGLPWLLWAYVVVSALVVAKGGVFTGHLIGYDDQVRMVQVMDWINNPHGMIGGWYDRTLMRADPPTGFTTIWSRIVDVPIALLVLFGQLFTDQRTATLLASALIPLTELAILFVAAPYFARPLVGKQKARLIDLFLIFTSILAVKYFSASGFLIGQVSHHPWYIILALLLFGAAARMAMGSARREPVIMMGVAIALFTAVGIEGYPLIAAAAATLALVGWAANRLQVLRQGMKGVGLGAALALLLLPMHQPVSRMFTTFSFAEPSILGVLLVAAAAFYLFLAWQVVRREGRHRWLAAGILVAIAVLIGGALVVLFPDILNGGAAGLSPAERKMALSEHFEARPVYKLGRSWIETVCFVMSPLIAFVAAVWALVKSRGRRRAVHFVAFAFLVAGTGMSCLYSRYYHHAMTAASGWHLWLLERIKRGLAPGPSRNLIAVLVFIVIAPFWGLLLPMMWLNAPFMDDVVFFPAAIQATPDACDSLSMAQYMNRHYSPSTVVDVPYWQSAQLLYQTDIKVDFLSNYPSHDLFLDNYHFFGTRDMEEARQIAARHGFDLVVACQSPFLYAPTIALTSQILLARLQANQPPAWLKRVETPGLQSTFLLYEVDRDAVQKGTP